MAAIPSEGQIILNHGYEFVVSNVRVVIDAETGESLVRYTGICTANPVNNAIRHNGYNGATYGHKVGWRTY